MESYDKINDLLLSKGASLDEKTVAGRTTPCMYSSSRSYRGRQKHAQHWCNLERMNLLRMVEPPYLWLP